MIEKFRWWIFTYVDGLIVDDKSAKRNAFSDVDDDSGERGGLCRPARWQVLTRG